MKKIFITIQIYCISLSLVMAQNVQLISNGFVSEFKAIDTLHYTEYKLEGKSAIDLKREDPTTLILRHSFGKTSKETPPASEGVFYTTRYYAYSDGTLQAPTSQIFFKPVDLGKFEKEVKGIGTVERHPFLDGYYFLNITDKNWLNGEKIFSLCNTLFESRLASVIEPVFVKQIRVENPLRPLQWNIRNNANVPGGVIGADMNVENAWNMGATGTGIRVAVIDDGVDLTHPDLVNNLLPGFDATGNNSGVAPTADNGHGTNCAGIIAATDNTDGVIGVAFNSRIIPIRLGTYKNNQPTALLRPIAGHRHDRWFFHSGREWSLNHN
jgi:subtilisin family serine protease